MNSQDDDQLDSKDLEDEDEAYNKPQKNFFSIFKRIQPIFSRSKEVP